MKCSFRLREELPEETKFLTIASENPTEIKPILDYADWLKTNNHIIESLVCQLYPYKNKSWENQKIKDSDWIGHVQVSDGDVNVKITNLDKSYSVNLIVLSKYPRLEWMKSSSEDKIKTEVPESIKIIFINLLENIIDQITPKKNKKPDNYLGVYIYRNKNYKVFKQEDIAKVRLEPENGKGKIIFVPFGNLKKEEKNNETAISICTKTERGNKKPIRVQRTPDKNARGRRVK